MTDRLYIFDTTLRAGNQTQGVDFGVSDKIAIARALDGLGIDYVEGGWPGANPTDSAFFDTAPKINTTMTPRDPKQTVKASDRNLTRLLGYDNRFHGRFSPKGMAYAKIEQAGPLGRSSSAEPLFGSGPPKLSDIRQSDNRSTCHMLSVLSSVLAQPDGGKRIQNRRVDLAPECAQIGIGEIVSNDEQDVGATTFRSQRRG